MPLRFEQAVREAAQCSAALFCYEAGGAPLHSRLAGGMETVAILTGSEGGFSPEEAALAERTGCTPVSLGPRILRCETAPIAALAVAMAQPAIYNDPGGPLFFLGAPPGRKGFVCCEKFWP